MLLAFKEGISSMIDTTNKSGNILINSTFENDLEDLLGDYRDLSSDTTYTNMIDEVLDDIDYYSGKTIAEIYRDLE